MRNLMWLALCALAGGCALDDVELDELDSAVTSENKLAANKLAANKLAANKLAANKLGASALAAGGLITTADGREVLSYIARCALPANRSLSIWYGATYKFTGEIGLAPQWEYRAPTASEKRWVSACVMARTNFYGQSVPISMRGAAPALTTTAAELAAYTMDEAAYYGDLFAATPAMYACLSKKNFNTASSAAALRKCGDSENNTTTDCGFTFTGWCHSAKQCTTDVAPYANCHISRTIPSPTIAEVITVFLQP